MSFSALSFHQRKQVAAAILAWVLGFGGYAASARAQTTSPASVPEGLTEIVVTATRREENLENVPLADTAVSQQQLTQAGIVDAKQLTALVPALGFSQGGEEKISTFFVRGVGTYATSDGLDTSVGVAIDGVPLARPSEGFTSSLVDLARVEVLEGPQGMLFGKNASAGLISVTTQKPILGLNQTAAEVSYGTYNDQRDTATINEAISDNSAIRGTFWRFYHDGYVDNVITGEKFGEAEEWGARTSYKIVPIEPLTVTLMGEWTGAQSDATATTIRSFRPSASGATLAVEAYETAHGIEPGPENYQTDSQNRPRETPSSQSYTALVDYSLGGITLSSTTSYKDFIYRAVADNSGTSAPNYLATSYEDDDLDQFSQEFRITSPSDTRLRYVAGVLDYYAHINAHFSTQFGSGGIPPLSTFSILPTTLRQYAGFGELTFDLLPALHVIAGGRISHDSNDAAVNRSYFGPPPTLILPGYNDYGSIAGPYNLAVHVSDTLPSWRFGLQYNLTDDIMAYVTASRGYKVAGTDVSFVSTASAFAVNHGMLEPEISRNYEVGIRGEFLNHALTLNLTAFQEPFSDFQVSLQVPEPSGAYVSINSNAKGLTTKGIEGQYAVKLGRDFSVTGNFAYIDARYTDFGNATCYSGQPNLPTGSAPVSGYCVGGKFQSLTGHALPNTPTWSTNIAANYQHEISHGLKVYADANYRYQTAINFSTVEQPGEIQQGYGVMDLGVGLGSQDERWKLRVYSNNLFQERFVDRINSQLSAGYLVQYQPYESFRLVALAASVKF